MAAVRAKRTGYLLPVGKYRKQVLGSEKYKHGVPNVGPVRHLGPVRHVGPVRQVGPVSLVCEMCTEGVCTCHMRSCAV